jgi:hypothetical protein
MSSGCLLYRVRNQFDGVHLPSRITGVGFPEIAPRRRSGGDDVIVANGQQRSFTMTMANTESRGPQGEATGQQGASGEGGGAREQIRDVKNQVVDQAKNTFQQAKERAGSSLGESKGQLADQIGTVADALRRTTEHLRSEDQNRIAGLTETLARQVDQVSNYIRNKDAGAMRYDLENVARRQPAVMIGGALVLGLIGARFLKSSERRRERQWSGQRTYGRQGNYAGQQSYGREFGYAGESGYASSRTGIDDAEFGRQTGVGGYGYEGGGGYAGA